MKRLFWIAMFLVLVSAALGGHGMAAYQEAPMLQERVEAGELPAVEERLPEQPYVVIPSEEIGQYGGTINVASTQPEGYGDDTLLMANPHLFMKPDPDTFEFVPDFPVEVDVSEDMTTYTLRFSPGLKWSDGHPYTADDIMFWYEQVLLNEDLTPVVGVQWRAAGEVVEVSKVDEYTVEFAFAGPKPYFIPDLVHISFHYYPKHFLKDFHPDFRDFDELTEEARDAGYDHWYQYFSARHENTWGTPLMEDLPTMAPYVLASKTSDRRVYERNPYYWKVDTEGNQLPYVDRIIVEITSDLEVVQGMIMSGAIDFAGVGTDIRNYPLYRGAEEEADFSTILWQSGQASEVIYMFNQTHEDEQLREIFQDVRFRRAMSLGIDRQEINDAIYFGRAEPVQYTVLPVSKHYNPEFAKAYTDYDPDQANELLDEMGLDQRDGEGFRLMPDGRRLTFTVEYVDIETAKQPNIELVSAHWNELGIDVRSRVISGDLSGERAPANLMDATLWHGDKATDVLFPLQSQFFVPHNPGWERTKWPLWGRYMHTEGQEGEEPPQFVKDIRYWWEDMMVEPELERRLELGAKILEAQAENLWVIGTVGRAPHPLVVSNKLGNFPEDGLWVWDTNWLASHNPEQIFIRQ